MPTVVTSLAVHFRGAVARRFSGLNVSTRAFISEHAVSMSLLRAEVFAAVPGRRFT